MAEHQPGFIQDDDGGLAMKGALDPAEQIQQHRQREFLAQVHQLFDFKDREIRERKAVRYSIEQVAHRAVHRVLPDGFADRFILNRYAELRERMRAAGVHAQDRVANFVTLARCGFHPVQRQDGVDPFHCPGTIPLGFQELQRAKRELVIIGGHREMQATFPLGGGPNTGGQRVHRHALIKGEDRHARIAAKLRGNKAQVR